MCGREVPRGLITLHHLLPKERGGRAEHRAALCRPCHKQLHATFSNKELEQGYDSIESLRRAPVLQPFLKWIRKQKADRNFRTLTSNAHPHARRQKVAQRKRWR